MHIRKHVVPAASNNEHSVFAYPKTRVTSKCQQRKQRLRLSENACYQQVATTKIMFCISENMCYQRVGARKQKRANADDRRARALRAPAAHFFDKGTLPDLTSMFTACLQHVSSICCWPETPASSFTAFLQHFGPNR